MIEFVQRLTPVKEEVVMVVDRRNELDVVIDLGDIEHRLKLQVHVDCWHRWRKFPLLRLLLARRRADGLA